MAPMTKLYLTLTMLPSLMVDRLHREDRGQTAAEYLGIIVVISAIIAVLFASDLGTVLTDNIRNTINNIFSGTSN